MTTTLHRNPPFRAEHIGSLLRPKAFSEKRRELEKGQISQADYKPIEDQVVKDIVKTQLDLGFHAISDGEYRRHMFWGTFHEELNGAENKNVSPDAFRGYLPDTFAFQRQGINPGESNIVCTGKISHPGQSKNVEQFNGLKAFVPKERWREIKMTLPAPEWYHMRYREGGAYPKEVYKNDEEYFADIAKAYHTELDMLYDVGCRNVQIDDPNIAYFCSESMLEGWAKDPLNTCTADEMLDKYIKFYNDCISKHNDKMHFGVHVCRGNYINSKHFSEGGYDRVARKFFNDLHAHTYYLEYDTPRAGTFQPLFHLPKNKNGILGVVTSKFPQMEDKEEMKQRVHDAADIVAKGNNESKEDALNRLGVSPQCGFASHEAGNALGFDDMINKLKLVRTIADEIWPGQP